VDNCFLFSPQANGRVVNVRVGGEQVLNLYRNGIAYRPATDNAGQWAKIDFPVAPGLRILQGMNDGAREILFPGPCWTTAAFQGGPQRGDLDQVRLRRPQDRPDPGSSFPPRSSRTEGRRTPAQPELSSMPGIPLFPKAATLVLSRIGPMRRHGIQFNWSARGRPALRASLEFRRPRRSRSSSPKKTVIAQDTP